MNIALGLALGAMFFGALADLMYKVAQNKGINAATFVLYQSLTFGIIIWAFGLILGQLSSIIPSIWLFGPPIGILSYLGIVLFVMSLKDGTKKMSKSDPAEKSRIDLTDSADAIARKRRVANRRARRARGGGPHEQQPEQQPQPGAVAGGPA